MSTRAGSAQPTAQAPHPVVLEAQQLSVTDAGGRVLLHSLDLALRAGEILALVGESGSGKTLTALALLRLLPPGLRITAGRVMLQQTELLALPERDMQARRGRDLGMVFQNPASALNPVRDIHGQLAETLKLHARARGEALRERARALLAEVGLQALEARRPCYAHQLSGGQQQRVLIAMALACEPRVLLADEPSSALDSITRAQILELLVRLCRQRRLGVLLITHDIAVVRRCADRVARLHSGRISGPWPAAEWLGRVSTVPHAPAPMAAEVSAAAAAAQDEPLLALDALSVWYRRAHRFAGRRGGARPALDRVSLHLRRAETCALVGASGSGKSTLALAILRLLPISGGGIRLQGQAVEQLGGRRLLPYRRQVQGIFQDPQGSLDPRLTVGESLLEGMQCLAVGGSREERLQRLASGLAQVELDPGLAARLPHQLSGGQLQRVAIARALLVSPGLLVCDEPTSALDSATRDQILALLARLQRELGLSLLFITHDLGIAAAIAQRVAVLHRGQLVEYGDTASVLARPLHAQTQALLEASEHSARL